MAMKTTSTNGRDSTNGDPLLTVSQVRKRFQMGRQFLYYQIDRGRIRAVRHGSRLLIPLSSATAFSAMPPLFTSSDGRMYYDRPSKRPADEVPATSQIAVKFTPRQREAADRVALACGISLSDLCRTALGDAIAEYDEGAAMSLRRIGRRPRK